MQKVDIQLCFRLSGEIYVKQMTFGRIPIPGDKIRVEGIGVVIALKVQEGVELYDGLQENGSVALAHIDLGHKDGWQDLVNQIEKRGWSRFA